MKLSHVLLYFFLFTGCTQNKEVTHDKNAREIYFEKGSLKIQNYVHEPKFLKLDQQGKFYFSQIDKLIKTEQFIFILDLTGQNHVHVFDLEGNFISRIGIIGDGPNEYRRLGDFDVAANGEVILLDRQRKKLLFYDVKGNFIKSTSFDFRADSFVKVKDGFLFGLVVESEVKELDGYQVLHTDLSMNVLNKHLQYPPDYMDVKFHIGLFNKSKDEIIYHKPVSDYLLKFNKNGELMDQKKLSINNIEEFQQYKSDYEKLSKLRSSKDFNYINSPPVIFGDLILGLGYVGNNKALFLNDGNKNTQNILHIKPGNFDHRNVNFPLFNYNDETLISYLDYELYQVDNAKENIPSEIVTHLSEGGVILLLYNLKSTF